MNITSAKLIIEVESAGRGEWIYTQSVYDLREEAYWDAARIAERGIERFLDTRHMKEALNWNVNGDDRKYKFRWVKSVKGKSTGRAVIFPPPPLW